MEKKKIVLKLEVHDGKRKQKAMQKVCSHLGVDSVAMEMKEKKVTIVGHVDIMKIVKNLRKVCRTDLVSVGPLVEATEKKKDEPKKMEPKEAKKPKEKIDSKDESCANPGYGGTFYSYGADHVEECPNGCVIV